MHSFEAVLNEILTQVMYTDPWVVGANGVPSSFFCCLYKLMLMRLTERQVYTLVRPDQLFTGTEYVAARNNPFVRAAGLLYVRYLSPPDQLWQRMSLFLMECDSESEFQFSSDQRRATVGDFVKQLLSENQFLGTVLPRIPTLASRDILAKLQTLAERRAIKSTNEAAHLKAKFRAGASCLVRLNSLWDEQFSLSKGVSGYAQVTEKWVPATVLSTVLKAPFSAHVLDEEDAIAADVIEDEEKVIYKVHVSLKTSGEGADKPRQMSVNLWDIKIPQGDSLDQQYR